MISFEIAQLMFHKPLQGGLCQIVNPYKHHHQGKAQKSEEKVGVIHSELIFGRFFRWVYAMYMGYLVQKCVLTYVITD